MEKEQLEIQDLLCELIDKILLFRTNQKEEILQKEETPQENYSQKKENQNKQLYNIRVRYIGDNEYGPCGHFFLKNQNIIEDKLINILNYSPIEARKQLDNVRHKFVWTTIIKEIPIEYAQQIIKNPPHLWEIELTNEIGERNGQVRSCVESKHST